MFTLVVGDAGSGKSAFAESLALSLPGRPIYLATMEPREEAECRARIARHRLARAGRGFVTVERPMALGELALPWESSVLLECVGNLVANELYSPGGGGARGALEGVEALLARCRHLTAVTNEVCSGGADYLGDTLTYLRALAWVNRELARRADRVVEVVCALPQVRKGAAV